MTNSDRAAFANVMLKLGVAFNMALSEEHFDVYFEALVDYELEFLEPAAGYLIRTKLWFPKPVELREAASQYRVEARHKALPASSQRALGERALTVDEVKAFLEALRARPEHAETLAEVPRKGAEALHEDARRLDAMGGRDMTDAKRLALEQFRRYQGGGL